MAIPHAERTNTMNDQTRSYMYSYTHMGTDKPKAITMVAKSPVQASYLAKRIIGLKGGVGVEIIHNIEPHSGGKVFRVAIGDGVGILTQSYGGYDEMAPIVQAGRDGYIAMAKWDPDTHWPTQCPVCESREDIAEWSQIEVIECFVDEGHGLRRGELMSADVDYNHVVKCGTCGYMPEGDQLAALNKAVMDFGADEIMVNYRGRQDAVGTGDEDVSEPKLPYVWLIGVEGRRLAVVATGLHPAWWSLAEAVTMDPSIKDRFPEAMESAAGMSDVAKWPSPRRKDEFHPHVRLMDVIDTTLADYVIAPHRRDSPFACQSCGKEEIIRNGFMYRHRSWDTNGHGDIIGESTITPITHDEDNIYRYSMFCDTCGHTPPAEQRKEIMERAYRDSGSIGRSVLA